MKKKREYCHMTPDECYILLGCVDIIYLVDRILNFPDFVVDPIRPYLEKITFICEEIKKTEAYL